MNANCKVQNHEFKIKRLKNGIDKVIYCLANEDTSDQKVIEEVRMNLVNVLKMNNN